ncbi:hypothetical protein Bca4012_052680 [Brassica carinata]|uniref:Uncharacterized protein n=2 Tax=Brassica TaxID=3705 RepID=A0A8X7RBY2_BRACI|nr:hypothetical protein Bca52824_055203 [Brassica carinata]
MDLPEIPPFRKKDPPPHSNNNHASAAPSSTTTVTTAPSSTINPPSSHCNNNHDPVTPLSTSAPPSPYSDDGHFDVAPANSNQVPESTKAKNITSELPDLVMDQILGQELGLQKTVLTPQHVPFQFGKPGESSPDIYTSPATTKSMSLQVAIPQKDSSTTFDKSLERTDQDHTTLVSGIDIQGKLSSDVVISISKPQTPSSRLAAQCGMKKTLGSESVSLLPCSTRKELEINEPDNSLKGSDQLQTTLVSGIEVIMEYIKNKDNEIELSKAHNADIWAELQLYRTELQRNRTITESIMEKPSTISKLIASDS